MNRSNRSPEARAAFREQAADAMRREPTEAEMAMDDLLHDMGLTAFETQVSIACKGRGEIVDFLVRPSGIGRLAIEVDGPGHNKNADARRDRRLWKEHSIVTLRVTNAQILKAPEQVRIKLMREFQWLDRD